jgi:CDP-paratose 2-epimerase
VHGASAVFHFAAQVAVTDSLSRPRHDFDVNAGGTLNLLEAIRTLSNPPILIYTSTNKVYGALDSLKMIQKGQRYIPACEDIAENGISESQNLSFHSPYGCSKGTADQYILDYSRMFGLPGVVFRMSCIYGDHQNGTEDQGWVAHFLIRANQGRPIRIYGDGLQVRDVLHVSDLLAAFEAAVACIGQTSGYAFNIGGGPRNSISLLELLDLMGSLGIDPGHVEFDSWRAADQRFYVSDTRKFTRITSWTPKVAVMDGLKMLQLWLASEEPSEAFRPNGEVARFAAAR